MTKEVVMPRVLILPRHDDPATNPGIPGLAYARTLGGIFIYTTAAGWKYYIG